VIEHVKRVHGYDPRTNDSDNEDRRVGGVHRDGFLQPVTAKQGWIGAGRTKSKSTGPTRPRRNKRLKQEWGAASPEDDLNKSDVIENAY
jgi:N-terminal acetyltransferase B complex catalytic subunit